MNAIAAVESFEPSMTSSMILPMFSSKEQKHPVLDAVTPEKIAIGFLVEHYLRLCRASDVYLPDDSLLDNENEDTIQIGPQERKQFCLLFLKLLQGSDLRISTVISTITRPSFKMPKGLISAWRRTMLQFAALDVKVSSLIDLMSSIEKVIRIDARGPVIHRSSVCGYFLRRLSLQFDKLSFYSVMNLFEKMKVYVSQGKDHLDNCVQEGDENLEDSDHLMSDADQSSYNVELAQIGQNTTPNEDDIGTEKSFKSRKEAELYIAQQVEFLEKNPALADDPAEIESMCIRIYEANPDFLEAYFLRFLNCLRVNDFSGALRNLSLGSCKAEKSVKGGIAMESNKTLRYSALNLAALHARFQNPGPALAALREAIMIAQEGKDYACLQHALGWLIRIRENEEPENQRRLIENLISKAKAFEIYYLVSLGLITQAQFLAHNGGYPTQIWDNMVAADLISAQTFDSQYNQKPFTDLECISFAQKSGFWSLFGRSDMSCILSQLLLNFHTLDQSKKSLTFLATEPVSLAYMTLARKLLDVGEGKACDKVIEFASKLFPNPVSREGALIKGLRLEVCFRRSLRNTDWIEAQKFLDELQPIDPLEAKFLKVELELHKGDAKRMEIALRELIDLEKSKLKPLQKVRLLVLKSEWYSLCSSYTFAMKPVLEARTLCENNFLENYFAIVSMHIAHIKLQLDFSEEALTDIKETKPLIIGHGDCFEIGRINLLAAKCYVKSVSTEEAPANLKKLKFLEATKSLKEASQAFRKIGAYHRVKDSLYMMARLYHALDMIPERNQISAEFKKIEEQFPTSVSSRLAQML